ncbi:MAG: hypothetical protein AB7S44_03720 [Spirochaetales bacterium]
MENNYWKLNNLPNWVKQGGMIKKIFPEVLKSDDEYILYQINSEAEALVGIVEFVYDDAIAKLEKSLDRAIKQKDGFVAKELASRKEQLAKDYAFVKKLYSNYSDISIAGFDFRQNLDSYIDPIKIAIKQKVSLKSLPIYPEMQKLNEYIKAAHTVLYYVIQMEKAYKNIVEKLKNDKTLDDFSRSQILDKQDFWFAYNLKTIKHDWGSISGALKRSLEGSPIVKVKNFKEKPFPPNLEGGKAYKRSRQLIGNIRLAVRTKENAIFAKTRLANEAKPVADEQVENN